MCYTGECPYEVYHNGEHVSCRLPFGEVCWLCAGEVEEDYVSTFIPITDYEVITYERRNNYSKFVRTNKFMDDA